jgi:hypothetical protein
MGVTRRSFLRAWAALLASPRAAYARTVFHLPLPAFDFDSFNKLAPDGQAYQWVVKTVFGKPDQNYKCMEERGWRPVPATRHNKRFRIAGETIEYGGCVLMERPIRQVSAVMDENVSKAKLMVSQWMDEVRENGFVCAVEHGRHTIDDGGAAGTDEDRADVWRGLRPT